MDRVILVNERDEEIGSMEKIRAHKTAALHRAFSIFIFNRHGHMLLQQRAAGKYHSPLLWTNACCSHPRPGEATATAAQRRLQEELGFQTPLTWVFHFTYKADMDNQLTEHEFDHVFIGHYDGQVRPDSAEVHDWTHMSMPAIRRQLAETPALYTAWFRLAFPRIWKWWEAKEKSGTPLTGA